MELKDKVIVITGGSEGLGLEVALKVAKEKAKVVIISRNEEKLVKAEAEILAQTALCKSFVCDVSDDKEVQKTFKEIESQFGKIDILINNAGIWYEGITEEHSAEKVRELFMINSVGPIYTTQAVLPGMKKNKSGYIFNISSLSGVAIEPGWPVYTATKHALKGFTDTLSLDLAGSGIKVTGFYPGGMDTELFNSSGFPKGEKQPWMMETAEVADLVTSILKQPSGISVDSIVLRSSNDHLMFEEK